MSFKKDVIFLMTMIIVTAKVIKCSTKSQKVNLNLVFVVGGKSQISGEISLC